MGITDIITLENNVVLGLVDEDMWIRQRNSRKKIKPFLYVFLICKRCTTEFEEGSCEE